MHLDDQTEEPMWIKGRAARHMPAYYIHMYMVTLCMVVAPLPCVARRCLELKSISPFPTSANSEPDHWLVLIRVVELQPISHHTRNHANRRCQVKFQVQARTGGLFCKGKGGMGDRRRRRSTTTTTKECWLITRY